MKNLNLFLSILLVVFTVGCSDNEEELFKEEGLMSKEYTSKDEFSNKEIIDSINMDIFGTITPQVLDISGRSIDEVVKELSREFAKKNKNPHDYKPLIPLGPYYKTSQRVTNLRNQKILWKGGTYPPHGVYFADIYTYPISIPIPSDVLYLLLDRQEPADNIGYKNYSTQEPGIASGLTYGGNGNLTFEAMTMAMKITRNVVGQNLNIYVPFNSYNVTYKYYFIKLR